MKFTQTSTLAGLLALQSTIVVASPVAVVVDKRQGAGQQQKNFPEPLTDPFYVVPANISAYQPGDVVRSRKVQPWVSTPFTSSYQVLYRTTNAMGEAAGTVGTIWAPLIPSKPAKIFSYQYAEDSLNLNCATSFVWSNKTASKNGITASLEGPVVVPWALNQGMYIISADHEGSSSAYIAGHVEGPAVLDGIRATINHQKLDVQNTSTALYGYSGGSHATVWASTLATSYAPELQIAGAAFGGTPIDPLSILEHANKGPNAFLVGGGMFGLGNAYAEFNKTMQDRFTPEGVRISQDMRDPTTCLIGGPQMSKYANFDFLSIFTGENVLKDPAVMTVLAKETLLANVSSTGVPVPLHPRYIYHGTADSILPYGPAQEYVNQQCQKGANIQFVSFNGGDHIDVAAAGLIGALRFLKQAFGGTTPKLACGTAAPALIPGTYAALDFLGKTLEDILQGVIEAFGIKIPVPSNATVMA